MAKQQQRQQQGPADQFSDDEMEQLKRYGQALGGGPTNFDEEVERELEKSGAYEEAQARHRETSAAKMKAA